MRFERRKKKEKNVFVSWKVYFSSCYFFITPFPSHFKDDFQNLRTIPITFKSLQMKHI